MLETVSARNLASSTTATPLSIESWESKRYTFRTHLSIQVFGCQRIFRLRKALPGRNDAVDAFSQSVPLSGFIYITNPNNGTIKGKSLILHLGTLRLPTARVFFYTISGREKHIKYPKLIRAAVQDQFLPKYK